MKKAILGFVLLATLAAGLWAQRGRAPERAPDRYTEYAPLEVHSVFPREVSPGQYQQVSQSELQGLAGEGWELVSVMPYVYRNEEHGAQLAARAVVTQTYPAYFFKRARSSGQR
ncbi:MAG TPA: hypothetical protein VG273_15010 [Bryobacteraceae bacterium]|jgi:hypothetical protein|nr:hypothetical protein [Bryobacteraceae bacterium]